MINIKLSLSIISLLVYSFLPAQTVVNSLQELTPYLDDDNANIKVTPGTYTITAENASDYGMFEEHYRTVYTLFPFLGNNSTFDFTDVNINIETGVLSAFGNVDVYEIRIGANNVTLKNLTLTDVGSVHDAPRKGANNIVIDGKNNVIDGFYISSRGSSPYGYGDIFGKGGGAMVALKKHCGILIRGDYNTLKNTTLIHKAFGHCVFFQAASHPTVDGCYIEGEMRSTDDILAEEGSGSTADNLGFMTVWDYRLPPGFMIALCEAGIRSYNAGETFIDGISYSRGTNDVTVLNTVVKNTRTACTISQGSGDRYIENLTSIGNEFGFGIGGGKVVNCFADAAYGPIYDGNGSIEGSVTLIAPENGYYNGSKSIASVTGGTFTMYTTTTDVPSDLAIKMGSHRSFRHQQGSNLMYQIDTIFSNATVNNHSDVAIDLAPGASNNDVYTCGTVSDNGSGNSINFWDNCELVINPTCMKSTSLTQAECYDDSLGVEVVDASAVGYIQHGDWVAYTGLDLTDMNSVELTYSSQTSGGNIEFRIGAVDGDLIAEIELDGTGNWTAWENVNTNISRVEGEQDLYLIFTGGDGYLFNLDKFGFSEDVHCTNSAAKIEAECYDDMSGIQTEDCSEGTLNVGWINDTDWMSFENIDLTNKKSIKARVSGKTTGSKIEVHLDALDGELISELTVSNTNGNQNWVTDSTNIDFISGTHDIYLVFKGEDGYLFNINSFQFSEDESIITNTSSHTVAKIEVYPNPTTGITHFSSKLNYEITNSLGTPVLSGEGSEVNLSNQEPGVYFLKMEDESRISIIKL